MHRSPSGIAEDGVVDGRDDPVYAAGFSGRVAPGQPHGSRPGLGDDILRKSRDDVPMKRFGRAEEIAELVLFMCSDRCEFMEADDRPCQ